MVKGNGILWRWIKESVYNPKRITLEKEFCINGYLLYSIIKGLWIGLDCGWRMIQCWKIKKFTEMLRANFHCVGLRPK